MAKRNGHIVDAARKTAQARDLFGPDSPCLLMVSGGSDSTALAYTMHELRQSGDVGPVALLHVNHKLRGQDAEDDAEFCRQLAEALNLPFFCCEVDVAREAQLAHTNLEAQGRHERYLAAREALSSVCMHEAVPLSEGRILTAHTADDRIESFYMRSIVGTGPGGFRSMFYRNGNVVRPLLDCTRSDLRSFVRGLAETEDATVVRDGWGNLWREDATNAHTDRFRAYVRQTIVPKTREWDVRASDNLVRSMNLIADEDDMLDAMADDVLSDDAIVLIDGAPERGWLLESAFGQQARPLQRRCIHKVLKAMLGPEERIDARSVERVLEAFADGRPVSGHVDNIQGDIAVSANKLGVRIEPMSEFRARRKKV